MEFIYEVYARVTIESQLNRSLSVVPSHFGGYKELEYVKVQIKKTYAHQDTSHAPFVSKRLHTRTQIGKRTSQGSLCNVFRITDQSIPCIT